MQSVKDIGFFRGLLPVLACWCLIISQPLLVKAEGPRYLPSSSSTLPLDITSNDYGRSALAPEALEIGQHAPAFHIPATGQQTFQQTFQLADSGPITVLIFYRGHW